MSDFLRKTPMGMDMEEEIRDEFDKVFFEGMPIDARQTVVSMVAKRFPKLVPLAKKQVRVVKEREDLEKVIIAIFRTQDEAKIATMLEKLREKKDNESDDLFRDSPAYGWMMADARAGVAKEMLEDAVLQACEPMQYALKVSRRNIIALVSRRFGSLLGLAIEQVQKIDDLEILHHALIALRLPDNSTDMELVLRHLVVPAGTDQSRDEEDYSDEETYQEMQRALEAFRQSIVSLVAIRFPKLTRLAKKQVPTAKNLNDLQRAMYRICRTMDAGEAAAILADLDEG